MAWIRTQKIHRNENNVIVSGSAAINETVYTPNGKSKSKHVVRERLGKVLWLDEKMKNGIFSSPTRGIIGYDSEKDMFYPVELSDERLNGVKYVERNPEVHTVFGDSYLLMEFLEKKKFLELFKKVFPTNKTYERFLTHLSYTLLKDGSRIGIDNFISKSFLSYLFESIVPSTLKTDTPYFSLMGDDSIKLTFFREYISYMKQRISTFGDCCYVDSTSLPNNIENNPFNYLCSHGLRGCDVQMRLVLILDDATQLPVWYTIIPGNLSDCNTINSIQDDVFSSLGITISNLILDAGYITYDFLQAFNNSTDKTFIGRMPFRKGFPHRDLYQIVKPLIGKGKYTFVRNSHQYFGYVKEDVEIANQKINAYVYVDIPNATKTLTAFIEKHEEEYENLKDKDKDYKNIEGGFFILLSNKRTSPKDLLDEYFTRTGIETVFKTAKTYLDLLPISKCSDLTVRGIILSEIISLITLIEFRKELQDSKTSVSDILGATQSLMCTKRYDGNILVETPNKQTKESYKKFDVTVPSNIKLPILMHKYLLD